MDAANKGADPEGLSSLMDRVLTPVYWLAKAVASAAVFLCAFLSTADILSTWLLHRSLLGVFELMQMLMVVIVFLGLAPAVRGNSHISVDLFRGMLPARVRRMGDVLSALVSLIVYLLVGYAGIFAAMKSLSIGEFVSGPVPFPVFPARLALTIGAALAVLATLALTIALMTKAMGHGVSRD